MLTAINWLKKNAALLLGGLAIFVMFACFVSGCNYHKNHSRCPEITTHTVILHDTIIYQIADTIPFYIQKTDTIIYTETIIQPVDTAEILKDYFALHVYNRHWEDSLLSVNLRDTITENRFLGNKFQYQILRPQTINNYTQDNSITYNKYLLLGISVPVKNIEYAEFSALGVFRRTYIGCGYIPQLNTFSIKGGVSMFKWQ